MVRHSHAPPAASFKDRVVALIGQGGWRERALRPVAPDHGVCCAGSSSEAPRVRLREGSKALQRVHTEWPDDMDQLREYAKQVGAGRGRGRGHMAGGSGGGVKWGKTSDNTPRGAPQRGVAHAGCLCHVWRDLHPGE